MEEQNNGRVQQILRTIRRTATHNLWLKLISFLLAFVLWFAITGGPRIDTTITVKLDLSNYIPDGWALADTYNEEFEITLHGRDDVIQRLTSSEAASSNVSIQPRQGALRAVQEPQWLTLSTDDVFIRNTDFLRTSSSSIETLAVNPDRILVNLDRRMRKDCNVRVILNGELPEGYTLFQDPPQLSQSTVQVSGARSRVSAIEAVTATLNLASINFNGPQVYSSRVLLERDPLLTYETREVVVSLDVVEVSERGRFTVKSILFNGIDEATERVSPNYRPTQFTVEISGPASWMQTLTAEDIAINLDLNGVERNTNVTLDLTPEMVTFSNPYQRQELVTVRFTANEPKITVRVNAQ